LFERFTEPARQVLVRAQDEARALRHAEIAPEHVLLGLLREEDGIAASVLGSLRLTLVDLRERVRGAEAGVVPEGQLPHSPEAKKVLELALREALSLGHNYIGTEHILLGLVRENEGVVARILLDLGADADKIRNEIIGHLSSPRRRREAESKPPSPDELEELARVMRAKMEAIEANEFEQAARYRDEERKLWQRINEARERPTTDPLSHLFHIRTSLTRILKRIDRIEKKLGLEEPD
jgi:ATP-dependent Clp protease ATP-binding subunit ClpA